MNVEIQGKISKMGEIQDITANFSKLEFIVDVTENDYTNSYPIQAINEKIKYVEGFKVGDSVSVKCNLIAKAFTSKEGKAMNFLNLNVWFIKGLTEENKTPSARPSTEIGDPNDEFPSFPELNPSAGVDDSLDLPF